MMEKKKKKKKRKGLDSPPRDKMISSVREDLKLVKK